jgi:3-oxoacyl-(acyl-carrier-protein) synthase
MGRASKGDDARVVITGIGLTTGLGAGREETWHGIRSGRSALRALGGPSLGFPEVVHGAPALVLDRDDREPLHTLVDRVAREAVLDAGLAEPGDAKARLNARPERVAALIGTSKGGIRSLSRLARGKCAADAGETWRAFWPSSCASRVAARWGIEGPVTAPVAACATGLVAVWQAAALIARGTCDVALAGAVDAGLEPMLIASFHSMKALARVDGDPARAVRPWDRRRSGFLVGEGGAVLVLERLDRARARGVQAYAEVRGGAIGADAFHLTGLNEEPGTLAGVIARAMERAGVRAEEVDHVNVHGTATRANDPLECRALRRALGMSAERVMCSANKAQIGHLLGAAGAVELALACLSIRDSVVPPIMNLKDPDEGCALDAAPVARQRDINVALKLSLGFGGHLAAVVLSRV